MRSAECERARQWASLGLDGELSQIEHALLRAHVGRCAACAAFANDLDGLTTELRAAPSLRPAATVTLPRSRSALVRTLQVGAAAAAVAAAVGLGSLVGSLSSHGGSGSATPAHSPRLTHVEQQLLAMARGDARPAGTGTVRDVVAI